MRCPSTTRRCVSPTSRVPASSSAGSRRSSSRKACGACSPASDGSRSLHRRFGVFAAIVLVAAGLAVPAAQAQRHLLVGIQDDAMTLRGNPPFTFSTLKQLRTQIVRINLNWPKQTTGGSFTSPRAYARICTAIWQGVHFTNFAGEKVGCGATGPRGNNAPRTSRPSISPIAFMKLARKAGLRNLDAYAHHPYYGKPSETPASKPGGSAVTLRDSNTLISAANKRWGQK